MRKKKIKRESHGARGTVVVPVRSIRKDNPASAAYSHSILLSVDCRKVVIALVSAGLQSIPKQVFRLSSSRSNALSIW